jgi:hypothetical protein
MRPTGIQEEDVEAVGEGLGEGVDEELETLGVEIWQFEEEPRSRRGRHSTIDVEPLENVLDRPHGLDTARRKASSTHGQ